MRNAKIVYFDWSSQVSRASHTKMATGKIYFLEIDFFSFRLIFNSLLMKMKRQCFKPKLYANYTIIIKCVEKNEFEILKSN